MLLRIIWIALLTIGFSASSALAQHGAPGGEWPTYGGDKGSTKYAPLSQINENNVSKLEVAWQWSSPENERISGNPRMGTIAYESTPIVVDGVMYTSSSHSDVIALDPATGKQIWHYDTKSWEAGRPTNLGFVHRGVSYWSDAEVKRIYIATGGADLIALDAETGIPVPEFGVEGD